MNIKYQQGRPPDTGVYAVRAEDVRQPGSGFLQDYILMWFLGKWWYLGSDAQFRGTVAGWIGPLPRKIDEEEL